MKFLKLFFIVSILLFNNNLFAQNSYRDNFSEKDTDLDIYLNSFSSDFYLGEKEISKDEFEDLIRENPSAQRDYIHGVNFRTFGNILEVGAGIVFGGSLYYSLYNVENRFVTSGSAAVLFIGILMDLNGRNLLKKSIRKYNQNYKYGFSFGLNKNGIGVVLNF